MDTIKVFKKINDLKNEIAMAKELLVNLNSKYADIMEECPHEIVFKYIDNFPRKMPIYGSYFCPCCGKNIKCFDKEQIIETVFSNSRVIPLNNLSLLGSPEIYDIIREEVYNNIDFYYDYVIPTEELSLKMEELLIDKQIKYEADEKTLRKIK